MKLLTFARILIRSKGRAARDWRFFCSLQNQRMEGRLIVVRRTDLTRCCVDVSYAGRELLVRAWLGKERVESLTRFDGLI